MLHGKKILVTGATGEVARGVTLSLAKDNEVWASARFSNAEARQRLESQGVQTFAWSLGEGDFTGLPDDFDYVVHSAASIFETKDDYDAAIRANAEGTGLLMAHVRKAKAFLHVSAIQVYSAIDDKSRPRKEGDPLGSHPNYAPSYGVSKVAAEAVVRTMARLFNLPTTIGRLGANYGIGCGGVADSVFRQMLSGKPMVVPPRGKAYACLVYNTDVINQIEPLLNIASVPATIVNWDGDQGVEYREMLDYMSEISGIRPTYEEREGAGTVAGFGDPTRRIGLIGPGTHWKIGVRETLRANFPDIQIA